MSHSFPPLPAGTRLAGRLVLDVSGALRLRREGQEVELPVQAQASGLREGDLVAVLESGETILLARPTDSYWRDGADLELLRSWADFKFRVVEFFRARGFLEIDTPSLVVSPGTEPTLKVFGTEWCQGSRKERRYLPTSPELHLKKALVRGVDRAFELRRCFRNDELTPIHQPEFWMLEWYRCFAGLEQIEDDAIALIHLFAPEARVERVTMGELFARHAGIELRPEATIEDYRRWTRAAGFEAPSSWGIDDLFFWLFQEKIESRFEAETVLIVRDWPPFQAALARVGPAGWAERFEIYWRGLELANAFHELTDPAEQERRFGEDARKKAAAGHDDIPPIDEEFLRALRAGLPPSAGIALGVERLFMAVRRVPSLASLRLFPVK